MKQMTQTGRTGYCEDVVTARQNGEKRLATYQETLGKIEAKLTDDDKAYYAQVYEGSWKPENKMPKWAALGGAVLFVLAAAGSRWRSCWMAREGTDELEVDTACICWRASSLKARRKRTCAAWISCLPKSRYTTTERICPPR